MRNTVPEGKGKRRGGEFVRPASTQEHVLNFGEIIHQTVRYTNAVQQSVDISPNHPVGLAVLVVRARFSLDELGRLVGM